MVFSLCAVNWDSWLVGLKILYRAATNSQLLLSVSLNDTLADLCPLFKLGLPEVLNPSFLMLSRYDEPHNMP